MADLRDWGHGRQHFDHDEREPVRCAGDPMLVDGKGKMHHYWGNALMVIFNRHGVATALEYVGCTDDRNYIKEVWRHELSTNTYKWKYLGEAPNRTVCTGQIEFDDPQFAVGDGSWDSETYPGEVPPEDFFRKFTPASRTFFINNHTSTFMQGPDFGVLHQVLKRPVTVSKTFVGSINGAPQDWMLKMVEMCAEMSGYHHLDHSHYHRMDNPVASGDIVETIKKVQVAQFALGLTVSAMGDAPKVVEAF